MTSQRDEGTALLTDLIGHHEGSAVLPAAWGQLSHSMLTDCCGHRSTEHQAAGLFPGPQNLVWIQPLPSQRTMADGDRDRLSALKEAPSEIKLWLRCLVQSPAVVPPSAVLLTSSFSLAHTCAYQCACKHVSCSCRAPGPWRRSWWTWVGFPGLRFFCLTNGHTDMIPMTLLHCQSVSHKTQVGGR